MARPSLDEIFSESSARPTLDEIFSTNQVENKKTGLSGAGKFLPTFISGQTPSIGERTLLGNIFERPGAAIRSAIRAPFGQKLQAYTKGAVIPEDVQTFQQQSLDSPVKTIIPTTGRAVTDIPANIERFSRGLGRDVQGFALDIMTNPAELLTSLVPATQTAKQFGKFISSTKPAQLTKKVFTSDIGQVAEKAVEPVKEVVSNIKKFTLDTTLGKNLSSYVQERGVQNIPKIITEDVPREIVKKLNNFFPNASNVVGKRVSDIINSGRYKDVKFNLLDIQKKISSILPKGVTLDDLDISAAERKILQKATEDVLRIGNLNQYKPITGKQLFKELDKKTQTLPQLWKLRRSIDDIIYSRNLNKPEAIKYAKTLRDVLNDPIRSAGDDIAKSFDRYAFIKNVEDELGDKFIANVDKSKGNIYSKQIADFIDQQFSGRQLGKKEVLEQLKDIERVLPINEKVIQQMMDYAASIRLNEPIEGASGFLRGFLNIMIGGKRGFAKKFGKFSTSPKAFSQSPDIISNIAKPVIGGVKKLYSNNAPKASVKFGKFKPTVAVAGSTVGIASNANAAEKTLGQKNNNPINLKAFEKWDGLTGKDKHGHGIFKDLDHGVRAAIKNFDNRKRKQPNQTLKDYFNQFAEKNGTKEAEYIAKNMGINVNSKLKDVDVDQMLQHVAKFESKMDLSQEYIKKVRKRFNLK